MDIDLVYLWVNGNDPKWQAKRDACIGRPTGNLVNCKGRYADSGELKYSLRSVEKYAPWIRKIFIVTDDQKPEWLNTSNPKIQVVDHKEIMPTEERGSIGMVKPTGWHTVKYDCITDRYLYNRCHLIGYQLAGENANEKNLITGTRYLNVDGMLPFENEVADYVDETDNHVLYRVTPVFSDDNLVASGVIIEAKSVEDKGAGVQFNVYCYNVQPGISIDYIDGQSWENQ